MIEEPSKTESFERAWEESIERDHGAIKAILEGLETTTDLHRLLPLCEQLRAALEQHFAREEEPEGLHELIASLAPNTVASLQNVLGEHQGFLERLDRLIASARACLEGPLAEILRDTAALSRNLRDHEARETKLFTDAVFTDLGRSS